MLKQLTQKTIAASTTLLAAVTMTGARPQLLPVRNRRGAGMLEYAMVALISIAVFAALFQFFPDFFGDITRSITERFNGAGSGK